MKCVLLIFGTRPEAIKMCPLVRELRRRGKLRVVVLVTGQHRELLDGVLQAFGVVPDFDLSVMREGQGLADLTARLLQGIDPVLGRVEPDRILVHGDTATALAGALAGFYRRIPVEHVEAGLRTACLDDPFPEEFNRRAVDLLASRLYAPTARARENLLREGCSDGQVLLTGNTVVDALRGTVRVDYQHPLLDAAAGKRLVLLTLHRRESLGEPMRRILRGIRRVAAAQRGLCVIFPQHKNPEVRRAAAEVLGDCPNVICTEPLGVVDFHNLLARCYLVLTDSGGIQEEAVSLGKPTLVLREVTERPEGVRAGTLRLVGTQEEAVAEWFSRLLSDEGAWQEMAHAGDPFGDGQACARIADALEAELGVFEGRRRMTVMAEEPEARRASGRQETERAPAAVASVEFGF